MSSEEEKLQLEAILTKEGQLDSAEDIAKAVSQDDITSLLNSPTPVRDIPKPCEHTADVSTICPTCLWPFCQDCASILDSKFCKNCLKEADAEIQVLPLTDPDGVTHANGRDLKPTGPAFGTLAKRIADMPDDELERHIAYYQDLVKQAERSLDFRRTVLGASQIESSQRADAKRRVLRGVKIRMPKGVIGAGANSASTKPKQTSTSNLAAAAGIPEGAISAILGLLTQKPKK